MPRRSDAEKAKEATDRIAEAAGGVPKRVKERRERQDARLSGIMSQIRRQRENQTTDSNN